MRTLQHAGFARGVSTNAGGTWRQLALPSNVPNRYISGLAIDPADPSGATAYLGFNGFSRRWIEGPGAGLGHLWKTTDGGATWTDVSGNLPDVPVNDVLLVGAKIVLATDLGVVVSADGGAHWSRLGGKPSLHDRDGRAPRAGRPRVRRDPRPRHLVDREALSD